MWLPDLSDRESPSLLPSSVDWDTMSYSNNSGPLVSTRIAQHEWMGRRYLSVTPSETTTGAMGISFGAIVFTKQKYGGKVLLRYPGSICMGGRMAFLPKRRLPFNYTRSKRASDSCFRSLPSLQLQTVYRLFSPAIKAWPSRHFTRRHSGRGLLSVCLSDVISCTNFGMRSSMVDGVLFAIGRFLKSFAL
jgi:hypothetical protein